MIKKNHVRAKRLGGVSKLKNSINFLILKAVRKM
jgi:hypothetical protein